LPTSYRFAGIAFALRRIAMGCNPNIRRKPNRSWALQPISLKRCNSLQTRQIHTPLGFAGYSGWPVRGGKSGPPAPEALGAALSILFLVSCL
jgi:hypothetical protein